MLLNFVWRFQIILFSPSFYRSKQGRSVGGGPGGPRPPPRRLGGGPPPPPEFHPHLGISYKSKVKNDSTRRKLMIFRVLGVKKCMIFKKKFACGAKNVSLEEKAWFFLSRAPNIVSILKSLCISSIKSSKIGQKWKKVWFFLHAAFKSAFFMKPLWGGPDDLGGGPRKIFWRFAPKSIGAPPQPKSTLRPWT